MIKDNIIHFKSEKYRIKYWGLVIKTCLCGLIIAGLGGIVVWALVQSSVDTNLIIVCFVTVVTLLYNLMKPITKELEEKFKQEAYLVSKIQARKVCVEKCNEEINKLVKKGYIIDKVSTMGVSDVLITYYIPISKEDEEARKLSLKIYHDKNRLRELSGEQTAVEQTPVTPTALERTTVTPTAVEQTTISLTAVEQTALTPTTVEQTALTPTTVEQTAIESQLIKK
ncbi:MAG: hypothetical protein ABS960_02665 [Solibacillus isronensis]